MKYVTKIFIFLFVSSTLLILGYEAVKYARDTVRIYNANTLIKTINLYQVKENKIPRSGPEDNVSRLLYEKKYLEKEE